MKKVVFYQQYPVPYFGVSAICSYLIHQGYSPEVVIEPLEKDPIATLLSLKPDLIGISVATTEAAWLKKTASRLKRLFPGKIIMAGGIHAILYPEDILLGTDVDIVCNSEGEYVVANVLRELEKEEPKLEHIKGITYRDEAGKICSSSRENLFTYTGVFLESSAIYYDRYPLLGEDQVLRFISGRGCPYNCGFCYNSLIRKKFSGMGSYVRQKDAGAFVDEIKILSDRFHPKSLYFYDDLFTLRKKWLGEFLEKFKKKVNLPFMCFVRADVVDDEIASMLSSAGCRTAGFGVETGDYRLRKEILSKDVTDEDIIKCGELLKKNGIKVQTTNMFCLPGETVEKAFKTIELNIRAKTDFAFSSLFLPFPELEVTEHCISLGYLKKDFSINDIPRSFMEESVLDIPYRSVITNIQRMAFYFIRFPWTYSLMRKIVFVKFLSPLIFMAYLLGNVIRHKEERGISMVSALLYAWRMRKHI